MTTATPSKVPQQADADIRNWHIEPPWGFLSDDERKLFSEEEELLNRWDAEGFKDNSLYLAPAKGVRLPDSLGEETKPCAHHWIIQPAFGATSKGVCKLCGEERIFQNYLEEDVLKDRSNFLVDNKGWDIPYEHDRDEEFIQELSTTGSQY